MPPTPVTQLPLPHLLDNLPPRIGPAADPNVPPQEVWRTVDPGNQTRIRLIWVRVMQEVSDERR